jgi:pyruvate dehydrogenase E2 component (dihydrolipoamide acetyltransferase)
VKGIRRTIAERLQRSSQAAPHIALTVSVDMGRAKGELQHWNELKRRSGDLALGVTALICRAVVASLMQHPKLNSHFLGDEIREYRAVHLGIAVALADGLVVPVIRNAETKDLASLQAEIADLSSRARRGRLQSRELKVSTFTLSNLGMFGVERFTAILNPPEVGILSVGVIQETPVALQGQVVIRPLMQVTLNVDHRGVDGAVAAQFIKTLKTHLENPGLFFP